MNRFDILDGSGYFYRAYYALPELNDKYGHNVNAVYGFLRMLFKFFQDKPDYFVIALDGPTKTIRHELYEQYKANRPKMPDNFKRQIGLIKDIIKDLSIPYIQIPGYEADDIIYTIANQYKSNSKVFIHSLDKDLKQILDTNVFCVNPMKGEITDKEKFKSEYGFDSKYMLDYLCILGDSSDNVPGVKGIGEKTAKDLISQYGSIDEIYQNIDACTSSVKQKLLDGKDSLYKCIDLIKLYEVPGLDQTGADYYKINIDFDLINKVLIEQLQFLSLKKQIDEMKRALTSSSQQSLF